MISSKISPVNVKTIQDSLKGITECVTLLSGFLSIIKGGIERIHLIVNSVCCFHVGHPGESLNHT